MLSGRLKLSYFKLVKRILKWVAIMKYWRDIDTDFAQFASTLYYFSRPIKYIEVLFHLTMDPFKYIS